MNTMTPDERNTVNLFKAAVNMIKTGPDGFPLANQGLELAVAARLALQVTRDCLRRGEPDAEQRSLMALTGTTSRIIEATYDGNRDPAIPEKWFRARAELVEPE